MSKFDDLVKKFLAGAASQQTPEPTEGSEPVPSLEEMLTALTEVHNGELADLKERSIQCAEQEAINALCELERLRVKIRPTKPSPEAHKFFADYVAGARKVAADLQALYKSLEKSAPSPEGPDRPLP